jgi:60 kDa SS-A/Ro ribonucleoprotein
MSQEYLRIGGTLGMAAYMKSEDPNFMCFESKLHYPNLSTRDSMTTNLEKVMRVPRGGTATGLCIEHLLGTAKNAESTDFSWGRNTSKSNGYGNVPVAMQSTSPIKCDNIVIITDEQQNAGSMVLSKFTEYRRKVNPNARLFIIDVAPYNGRSLAPQGEPNCYFIYGWSDEVLKYLAFVTEGIGTQVDAVNKIELRVG